MQTENPLKIDEKFNICYPQESEKSETPKRMNDPGNI